MPDERSEPAPLGERERRAEEPIEYCPRCSQRLLGHRCKLVCTRCGYYMSCADYY